MRKGFTVSCLCCASPVGFFTGKMADQFLHQGGGAKNRSRHIVSTVIIAAAKVEEME